jgi:hypothetical protein
MNCQQAREQFLTASPEIEAHLSECPSCAAEIPILRDVWQRMDNLLPEEEPPARMSARFYAMLEGYRQGQEAAKSATPWWQGWFPHPAYQAALATLLIGLGLAAGAFLSGRGNGGGELEALRRELHSTRQMVVLSMMTQQSASERLEGVSTTRTLRRPDPEVREALFQTFESDPNVNVRLAALDALRPMLSQPGLLKRLLDSLIKQPSPLVQVSVIDLMVETRHREALGTLEKIRGDQDVNETVRQRAEWAIQQLGGGA